MQYESPVSSGLKVMAKVKVSVHTATGMEISQNSQGAKRARRFEFLVARTKI